MHSPPLSNTGEEEEQEMNSAATAAASVAQNTNTITKETTTPPWTTQTGQSTTQSPNNIAQQHSIIELNNNSKVQSSTTKVSFYSVSERAPPLSNTDSGMSGSKSDDSTRVLKLSDEVKKVKPLNLQQTKEKTIQNVLKQGKVLKSSSDPDDSELEKVNDVHLSYHSSAPSTPSGRYRSRMPSLSQYKDSELFQPAKSLMEIATSKPEPGYSSPRSQPLSFHSPNQSMDYSPFHRFGTPEPLYRDATPTRDGRWSGYSTPVAPSTPVQNSIATFEDEEQDANTVTSTAQVARTILMLSSPTRPPPRSLNQAYMDAHSGNLTHAPINEWTAPYSPSTSSPLVQFQTNASSLTPSPDQTPSMISQSGSSFIDESRAIQKGSPHYAPKSTKLPPYTNLYEPSSPSPLSTALFPSSLSNDHLDRIKPHSRSSSPTLKRAVRFAASLTNATESSKMPVDVLREKTSGSHYRPDYNGTVSNVYPGPQPGYEDNSYGPALPLGDDYHSGYININGRSKTPPPITSSYPHYGSPPISMRHHGMRTPPSSGGKDLNIEYSMGGSIPRKRRNSGPLEASDLPTMFRHVTSSSPNLPSTNIGTTYRR
ncbi:hypothetical protein BGZ76_002415 [Entomortierella beljakovae]|nr:hypothetical protein BGZ76_002415 [Entomortierella beljakovae]